MDHPIHGNVKSIVRLRINSDGAGVRSVVFLYGCPLDCRWCCNPETRFGDQYREVTPVQLLELVLRDLIYFRESGGGITFTGGEPLMQAPFIREFARLSKDFFPIHVETSLYAPREAVETLLPCIDHWYIDCKAPDEDSHRAFTGVSRTPILENLAFLAGQLPPERITLTCPLIPGLTATEDYAHALVSLLRQLGLHQVELHPHRKRSEGKYAPLGLTGEAFPALPAELLDRIRTILTESGFPPDHADAPAERRKCEYLKAIRRSVAARYAIPVDIPDCSFRGRCPGTCPRCEQELAQINGFLRRQNPSFFPETKVIPAE